MCQRNFVTSLLGFPEFSENDLLLMRFTNSIKFPFNIRTGLKMEYLTHLKIRTSSKTLPSIPNAYEKEYC